MDKMITFLVCSDFKLSAKCLDNKRLGKQRVEAHQILNICYWLQGLGLHYNDKLPPDPYSRYDWIRRIMNLYKLDNYYYIFTSELKQRKIPKNFKLYKFGFADLNKIQISTNYVLDGTTMYPKLYPREYCILPDEWFVDKSTFVYHPIILMWLSYENALKEYIDAHVDEWISRGFNNNYPKLSSFDYASKDKDVIKPDFIYDSDFHLRHQSNLLRKNNIFYKSIFPSQSIGDDLEYFWPYTPHTTSGLSDHNKRYLKVSNFK